MLELLFDPQTIENFATVAAIIIGLLYWAGLVASIINEKPPAQMWLRRLSEGTAIVAYSIWCLNVVYAPFALVLLYKRGVQTWFDYSTIFLLTSLILVGVLLVIGTRRKNRRLTSI